MTEAKYQVNIYLDEEDNNLLEKFRHDMGWSRAKAARISMSRYLKEFYKNKNEKK